MAAFGDRVTGDGMRTAAGRARAANPRGRATQSRRARSAVSKIQVDLRAVLPQRTFAMAREDGAARTRGGRRAAVLRRARAAERDRGAGASRRCAAEGAGGG